MTTATRRLLVAVLVSCGLAVLAARCIAQDFTGCEPRDGLEPICRFQGSEDIESLPDGHTLLVSESQIRFGEGGSIRWLPSALVGYDVRSRRVTRLYPYAFETAPAEVWGDATCREPIGARMSPLGLHLYRRTDGRLQLLVVNHGARESVEFFEVRTEPALALTWRGCVVAPPDAFLNDVATLSDDAFVTTQYVSLQPAAGVPPDQGVLLRWDRGTGIRAWQGTEARQPNGVQTSRDGAAIYVAVADAGGEVRVLDARTGVRLRSVASRGADNFSWAPDGRLLVAGRVNPDAPLACRLEQPCGDAFAVDAVDPATLAVSRLFEHAGPPLGLGTVAVQVGDDLYIGSPAGDRILRVPAGRWGDRRMRERASR